MTPAQAGRLLRVNPPDLRGCRTMIQAAERLQAWKDGPLQAAWRREARLAHPDRPGGSDEQMKRVNKAREVLRELEVTRAAPARPAMRVVVQGYYNGAATTCATTTSATGWPFAF